MDKVGNVFPLSFDRVIEISQVPDSFEPATGLRSTMGQSESSTHQLSGPCGTGDKTEMQNRRVRV